ncbi:MAG: alpha/beta fold hydrolase [Candidatus Rokubacteria bacterium]|nr:alpha/beta fold hydrolase [Candidatus Rokubacteria bacterium]
MHVPEAELADLRARLARVRWPDEIPGGGWRYGSDLGYMKALVAYWRDAYDWRAQEARLNEFPQFTVPLGGIDLHFIRVEGKGPRPLPLLLSHGWPGSVWEFHRLIPLLTDPARFGGDPADAFTVVAPSLPGYGFSFRPNQDRFGIVEIADLFAALMQDVLGYSRFGAHGGDWGCAVTARLGAAYPERLTGVHVTNLFVRGGGRDPATLSPEERQYFDEARRWQREEAGYQWIQGTRPQTLAYGLTDSPVGLAAWIVDKYRSWSDCGGEVEQRFTKDVLLTSVMIYWASGAINSSFWPYYAHRHAPWSPAPGERIGVPLGFADFPRELLRPPRSWVERVAEVRRWTTMAAGGHFAALEEPEALARDIREFFRELG